MYVETPKKPFLIKSVISDRLSSGDGIFDVTDEPILLTDDNTGLDQAELIISGQATEYLPVVYFSSQDEGEPIISAQEMSRFSLRMGGLAHVVVEPSRSFSFSLRDATTGTNPYGGSVAVFLPKRGMVRRFYLGGKFSARSQVIAALESYIVDVHGRLASRGWDWAELQEQAFRFQRARDKERLSSKETEQLYEDEISSLNERVAELQARVSAGSGSDFNTDTSELSYGAVVELYDGETHDRVRLACELVLEKKDLHSLDDRTIAMLEEYLESTEKSIGLGAFRQELKQAAKNPRRLAQDMERVLGRVGFTRKSDNKHIRLEPSSSLKGLSTITLPKTPSETRGQKNLVSQIESVLGVTILK